MTSYWTSYWTCFIKSLVKFNTNTTSFRPKASFAYNGFDWKT